MPELTITAKELQNLEPNEPVFVPRLRRTSHDDGATETCTLVRVTDGPLKGQLFVDVTAGPNGEGDFVGLYTVDDGVQVSLGNWERERVTHADLETYEQFDAEWNEGASYMTLVEELD